MGIFTGDEENFPLTNEQRLLYDLKSRVERLERLENVVGHLLKDLQKINDLLSQRKPKKGDRT